MRTRRQTSGPSPQDYRNLAIGVLGLGVIAGMIVSSDAPAPAPTVTKAPVRTARPVAVARPANPFAVSREEAAEPEADPPKAPPLPPPPPEPALGPGKNAAQPRVTTTPTGPSPAQIERLIAASRARSGGVDQGDEG